MKVILLGAGQVGASLAENLALENNDVTLVDINEERLQVLQEQYDIRTIQGFCSYPSVLRRAGAENADMVVAVTDNDEANMVACQVAYSIFKTPIKIARIRSPQYFARKELYGTDDLPIDVFILPEELVTTNVERLISYPGALQVLDFAKGKVKMAAIKPYYGGPLLGKSIGRINEQFPKIQARIVAIYRNDHAIPFDKSTVIEIGDEVFFVAAEKYMPEIMVSLRRVNEPYKRIIIAGGGDIGLNLANALQKDYQVKIIERNRQRCEYLARQLDNVLVLNGESSDRELLITENIESVDVFCAVTNDDEVNIISSLQAKRLGVRQVMSLINRTAYIDLIEGGPINIAISPHQATASAILTYMRRGDIINVYSLRRGAAEAIEIVAHGDQKTSKVVGRTFGQLKLPPGTKVGMVVRKDEVILPTKDLVIEADDHIILFASDKKYVRDVEKLFQVSAGFF